MLILKILSIIGGYFLYLLITLTPSYFLYSKKFLKERKESGDSSYIMAKGFAGAYLIGQLIFIAISTYIVLGVN